MIKVAWVVLSNGPGYVRADQETCHLGFPGRPCLQLLKCKVSQVKVKPVGLDPAPKPELVETTMNFGTGSLVSDWE